MLTNDELDYIIHTKKERNGKPHYIIHTEKELNCSCNIIVSKRFNNLYNNHNNVLTNDERDYIIKTKKEPNGKPHYIIHTKKN